MTERPPTVVVVDDHVRTRDLTCSVLEADGFQVVGVGGSADDAVALVHAHRPDVCLLDIHMPGNGITAAATISSAVPETVIVMLTVASDDENLFTALRSGAQGYLLKGSDADEMVGALRRVLAGEPALSPGLAMRILDEMRGGSSRRVHVRGRGNVTLSAREAEVLQLLRQGLGTAEIARRLYISAATVRSHVASVLRKLQADDRAEAVRLVEGPAGAPPERESGG